MITPAQNAVQRSLHMDDHPFCHRRPLRFRGLGLLALLFVLLPTLAFAATEPVSNVPSQLAGQVFSDNLTVRAGEVYDGDVTVLSGNVIVERDAVIKGNLNVIAGNIDVHEGGEVEGNISALSGNIRVAGEVGGDVAAMSGDIELLETADVGGDVSVVSGNLRRAPGADVEGNVVRGGRFSLPAPFSGNDANGAFNSAPQLTPRVTFLGWLGRLALRMVLAVVLTVVVVGVVALAHNLRPDLLRPVYTVMVERTAFAFVVGLLVNLVLFVITSGLFATILLCLGGLLTGAILLVLNLVGWAVVAQYVGNRLADSLKQPMQLAARAALGALVLTGLIAFLWALTGAYWAFGFVPWLLVSAPGVGAAIVHWLKLDGRTATAPSAAAHPTPDWKSAPPAAPSATPAPPEPYAPTAAPPAEEAAVTPQPVTMAEAPIPVDDFTLINGIGPTFDRRLKAAGIRTFAELAALSPEAVAAIIGWQPQRVINDDLIGQARRLAGL